jgi:hypothetical protein
VPLCESQIPLGLTWTETRASAVRSQQLTTCAIARPLQTLKQYYWLLWVGFGVSKKYLQADVFVYTDQTHRDSSLHCQIQTESRSQTAPYAAVIRVFFHGDKRAEAWRSPFVLPSITIRLHCVCFIVHEPQYGLCICYFQLIVISSNKINISLLPQNRASSITACWRTGGKMPK